MSRFYTDPFKPGAEMVTLVEVGPVRFAGYTMTQQGTTADWVETLTYSDGRTASRLHHSLPCDSFSAVLLRGKRDR